MEYNVSNEERFTDEVQSLLENVNDEVTSNLDGNTLTLTLKMDVSEFLNGKYERESGSNSYTSKHWLQNVDRFGIIQGLCFEFKKMITDWCIIPKEVK